MMSVLIAYASPRSSAAEIADQIADRLLKSGFTVVVRPVGRVESVRSYRSVILGSDVCGPRWPAEVSNFLSRFSEELTQTPLWLFSSGRADEAYSFSRNFPALVETKPSEIATMASANDRTHVRSRHHFAGTFERGGWSFLQDLFSKICGGALADRRDWRDINAWAADIAQELQRMDHVKERRRLHLSVRGRP